MRTVRRWEKKYRISIVAIQREVQRTSVFGKQSSIQSRSNGNPQPEDVIDAGSTLLISGRPSDLTRFAEEVARDDPS